MKKINKKAISRSFLIKLIIFLAAVVVLILFTVKETGIISSHSAKTNCELTAIKSAQTGRTRLNCPRKEIIIEKDKIVIDKTPEKTGKISEKDIKRVLADEMAYCWKKFGKGDLNVFSSKLFTSSSVCSVCAEVHFKDFPEKSIADLEDYLKNNKVPKKYSKENISYYNFMTKEQRDKYVFGVVPWTQWTPWGLAKDSIYSDNRISTKKDYAIIYKEYVPSTANSKTGAESRGHYIILKSFGDLANCCCNVLYE